MLGCISKKKNNTSFVPFSLSMNTPHFYVNRSANELIRVTYERRFFFLTFLRKNCTHRREEHVQKDYRNHLSDELHFALWKHLYVVTYMHARKNYKWMGNDAVNFRPLEENRLIFITPRTCFEFVLVLWKYPYLWHHSLSLVSVDFLFAKTLRSSWDFQSKRNTVFAF